MTWWTLFHQDSPSVTLSLSSWKVLIVSTVMVSSHLASVSLPFFTVFDLFQALEYFPIMLILMLHVWDVKCFSVFISASYLILNTVICYFYGPRYSQKFSLHCHSKASFNFSSAFIATFDNLEKPTICPFVVNGMPLHINILPRYIIVFLQWSIWFMATFSSLWIFEPGKIIFLTINFYSLHYCCIRLALSVT